MDEEDDYSWGVSDREVSAVARRMAAHARVDNDRSYIGVALLRAVIEG